MRSIAGKVIVGFGLGMEIKCTWDFRVWDFDKGSCSRRRCLLKYGCGALGCSCSKYFGI